MSAWSDIRGLAVTGFLGIMAIMTGDQETSKASVATPAQKTCFVISPISGDGTDVRKRSDQVLRHLIEPVVQEFGYNAIRADKIDVSGSITSQVLSHIVDAELVVADLTGMNPNVFYELAVRHSFARPYVQLIANGEKIPFDIADYRTIFFDYRDLDSVDSAKTSLRNMIREYVAGSDVDTPLSRAVSIEDLKNSSDPEKQEIASIAEKLDFLISRTAAQKGTSSTPAEFVLLRRFVKKLGDDGRLYKSDQEELFDAMSSRNYLNWLANIEFQDDPKPYRGGFADEPPF